MHSPVLGTGFPGCSPSGGVGASSQWWSLEVERDTEIPRTGNREGTMEKTPSLMEEDEHLNGISNPGNLKSSPAAPQFQGPLQICSHRFPPKFFFFSMSSLSSRFLLHISPILSHSSRPTSIPALSPSENPHLLLPSRLCWATVKCT